MRQPLSADPRAELVLYLSYKQFTWPFMTLIVVPAAAPAAAVVAVREEVARLDPSQAIGPIQRLEELRGEWLTQPKLQTLVVGGIANFTAAASGVPAPTIQWQVSVNGGKFADILGATSTTVWPPSSNSDNKVDRKVTISGQYSFTSPILFFWPGGGSQVVEDATA